MFVIGFHIVVKTVITFLALYGLHYIIRDAFGFWRFQCSNHNANPVIVVKVKNHEESIECVIKDIVFKMMKTMHAANMPDILIVDFGSDDSTPEIAQKLADDFPFIYYTTSDLYNETFKSLKNDEL